MYYETRVIKYKDDADLDSQLTMASKNGWKPVFMDRKQEFAASDLGIVKITFEVNDL